MVQINFASREVSCKVVYYGPGYCGKTTSIQQVHEKAPPQNRGNLTSIATEGDRTLFFDFMPLELGSVAGMKAKFQLYTVPGQVFYNATRKIVLAGVDGVMFVADSSRSRKEANVESWRNLEENLQEYGLTLNDIPIVIQFNKRDAEDAMPVEEMQADLDAANRPGFETVALTGQGVMPSLRKLISLVLSKLNQKQPRRSVRPAAAIPQDSGPTVQESSPVEEEALVPVAQGALVSSSAVRAEAGPPPVPAAASVASRAASAPALEPLSPPTPSSRRRGGRRPGRRSGAGAGGRGGNVTFSDEVNPTSAGGKILLVILGAAVIVAAVMVAFLIVGGD